MLRTVKPEKDIGERITEVAIQLAEEGGYDNVRQRDVAIEPASPRLASASAAREDILSAAPSADRCRIRLEKDPPAGANAEATDRVHRHRPGAVRRPNYARGAARHGVKPA
jgi:hypothetical protein